MFRHQGKSRTYRHNLQLASVLSIVAGIVNITGVLSVKVLTTNVTGHFAYFAEELEKRNYSTVVFYFLFILSFLFGAFVSNLIVEIVAKRKPSIAYVVPMVIEIIILLLIAAAGKKTILYREQIACGLLFAMGLQNALVTKVSQSVVRTTHLTGLFTDLGIELSQMIFYRKPGELLLLSKSILLKLAIISCFFVGCIAGGLFFGSIGMKTLLLADGWLLIALFYDSIRFRYYYLKRKLRSSS